MPPPSPHTITSYLARRGISPSIWPLEGVPDRLYAGAVIIPALAECSAIPLLLASLAANPPALLDRFLILIVVNNRVDALPADKEDNRETLARLAGWRVDDDRLQLHWIDAASAGQELPLKQGVGLARKIGMDRALPHLDYSVRDPLLICLDADTVVQPDYLPAISAHFSVTTAGGASIPYRHRSADSAAGQSAIDRYELFLRSYILGLEQAGSPYAFHTVGSAMACRASAYVASGGMNRRLAGEDFYFLQQIHKVAGVTPLAGTCVHPSPRSSQRVPFGTGRAVGDMLSAGEGDLMFYQAELFTVLGAWLKCATEHGRGDSDELLAKAGEISTPLVEFLGLTGFAAAWENMLRNNPDPQRLKNAFHGWFDAFRTMRLLHHLTECGFSRIPPEEAVPQLLERAGYRGAHSVSEMMNWLSERQGAGA